MADQRQALRSGATTDEPEESGGKDTPGGTAEGQLRLLGDPQRRRRLGAPDPPAHGGAPHGHAQRQARGGCRRQSTGGSRTPGRRGTRGPGGPGPGRVGDHLPGIPRLPRPVRGALPQPRARGPRHDVRLGGHLIAPVDRAWGGSPRPGEPPTGPLAEETGSDPSPRAPPARGAATRCGGAPGRAPPSPRGRTRGTMSVESRSPMANRGRLHSTAPTARTPTAADSPRSPAPNVHPESHGGSRLTGR